MPFSSRMISMRSRGPSSRMRPSVWWWFSVAMAATTVAARIKAVARPEKMRTFFVIVPSEVVGRGRLAPGVQCALVGDTNPPVLAISGGICEEKAGREGGLAALSGGSGSRTPAKCVAAMAQGDGAYGAAERIRAEGAGPETECRTNSRQVPNELKGGASGERGGVAERTRAEGRCAGGRVPNELGGLRGPGRKPSIERTQDKCRTNSKGEQAGSAAGLPNELGGGGPQDRQGRATDPGRRMRGSSGRGDKDASP
jgi:hypothetical protein